MATDPLSKRPPDDTGADTFRRYRYQAKVVVPYCLDCAQDGSIEVIYPEHFEDVALRTSTRWRFIQIKTRDPERGPWQLGDVTGQSGGLRSLLRSHRALTGTDCTLELHIEGAIKQGDDLLSLQDRSNGDYDRCRARVGKTLDIDGIELDEFLDRVRVVANLPSRESIDAHNVLLLGSVAGSAQFARIQQIYDSLVELISKAMEGRHAAEYYPHYVIDPACVADEALRRDIAAKALNKASIVPLLTAITGGPGPLLRKIVDDGLGSISVLQQKLMAGGATEAVIADAKGLRAQAAERRIEVLASGTPEDHLESLHQALRVRVNSKVGLHEAEARPASRIWDDLILLLGQQAHALDPNAIFMQNTELLLGEVCELADQCEVDFGVVRAT